jgi:hypothetical protein
VIKEKKNPGRNSRQVIKWKMKMNGMENGKIIRNERKRAKGNLKGI